MKWTKESHSKSCFILACRRFYFLKYLYICRKDDLTVNQFLWEKSCLGEENWGKNCCFGGTENTLKSIQGAIWEKQKKIPYFHHLYQDSKNSYVVIGIVVFWMIIHGDFLVVVVYVVVMVKSSLISFWKRIHNRALCPLWYISSVCLILKNHEGAGHGAF